MRNLILLERPIEVEDRILKSYAILKNSRLLSLPEAYEHISNIKLGVELGYIRDLHPNFFKEAFFRILPSHIKVFHSLQDDDFLKESEMRALLIQELLDKYYAG
jgi:protein arginine kinase